MVICFLLERLGGSFSSSAIWIAYFGLIRSFLPIIANLCAAAAHLIEEGDGLDVSISWALTHAPFEPASVRFEPSDADVLSAAAWVLMDYGER